MSTTSGSTRAELDPYSPRALRALRRGWALTRWVTLVVAVGLGVAAIIAITIALLATLLQNSV